jgi:hypothetical protein
MERDRVNAGLVAWCRKYDLRIMSMATVLQAYEYIEGGMKDHTEEVTHAAKGESDTNADAATVTTLRRVIISRRNLLRAIRFVEGYLQESQAHFYEAAKGITEFGPELLNFLAYRVTNDDREDIDVRLIPRRDLTHNGPASVREVADVDQRKEVARRWIQTLMDYGYIEPVWDKEGARQFRHQRGDLDAAWYRVRDEVFQRFSSEEDREWLRAAYRASRGDRPAHGRGRGVEVRDDD